jgi:hypothetical protein
VEMDGRMDEAYAGDSSRDVFLCHTSADRKYVELILTELRKRGITYWYDKAEVKWGDRISTKIDEGLGVSKFVVVFLSEDFVGRNWPVAELSSAISRENAKGETFVLPIVIGDKKTVLQKYSLLRGKRSITWSSGVSAIVDELQTRLLSDASTMSKTISDSQLLDELLKLGSLLGDLRDSTRRLPFATQLLNGFVNLLMRKYGIPTHEDATDVDAFLREIESDAQEIPTLRADLDGVNVSLAKLRDTVLDIRHLLGTKPARLEFGEDVWRNLAYLYGILLRLLLPGATSEVPVVMQLIAGGETRTVGFKSSMRYDMKEQRINRDLAKAVAKELAGFMNSEGGTLLLGVDDDRQVVGLEKDLETIPGRDLDGFERCFHETVSNYCGRESLEYIENAQFVNVYDKTIFVIKVSRSPRPIYFVDGERVLLHTRIGNETRPLNTKEAIEYYQLHWQDLYGKQYPWMGRILEKEQTLIPYHELDASEAVAKILTVNDWYVEIRPTIVSRSAMPLRPDIVASKGNMRLIIDIELARVPGEYAPVEAGQSLALAKYADKVLGKPSVSAKRVLLLVDGNPSDNLASFLREEAISLVAVKSGTLRRVLETDDAERLKQIGKVALPELLEILHA